MVGEAQRPVGDVEAGQEPRVGIGRAARRRGQPRASGFKALEKARDLGPGRGIVDPERGVARFKGMAGDVDHRGRTARQALMQGGQLIETVAIKQDDEVRGPRLSGIEAETESQRLLGRRLGRCDRLRTPAQAAIPPERLGGRAGLLVPGVAQERLGGGLRGGVLARSVQKRFDEAEERLRLDRLGQDGVEDGFGAGSRHQAMPVRRDRHELENRTAVSDLPHQTRRSVAVEFGKVVIDEGEVVSLPLQHAQACKPVAGGVDSVAARLQNAPQEVLRDGIVFDEEDARGHRERRVDPSLTLPMNW